MLTVWRASTIAATSQQNYHPSAHGRTHDIGLWLLVGTIYSDYGFFCIVGRVASFVKIQCELLHIDVHSKKVLGSRCALEFPRHKNGGPQMEAIYGCFAVLHLCLAVVYALQAMHH